MPKGDSKVEENKKQTACILKRTKIKTLKSESREKIKSNKLAQKEPIQKELA